MDAQPDSSGQDEQRAGKPIEAVDGIASFRYTKLAGDTDIRLFRIVRASPDDPPGPLEISLMHVSLKDAPRYSTLSYCWGSDRSTQLILCSGRGLEITSHLHVILSSIASGRLEPCGEAQFWWVDQICINQADSQEKTHQVGLMKEIYTNSSLTLAWLSSSQDSVDPATGEFWQYVEERRVAAPDFLPYTEPPSLDSLGLFEPSSDKWKPLIAMLQQPWFERIWVIQEVVYSKSAVWFYYSGLMIHYEVLHWLFTCLSNHRVADSARGLEFGSIATAAKLRPSTLVRKPGDEARKVSTKDSTIQLSSLLAFTLQAKATDPRDRIYALYSFLSWERDPFLKNLPNKGRADYTCDTYTLFRDVTRFCVAETQNLWAISHGGYMTDGQEICKLAHDKIPSWALRLDLQVSGQHVQRFQRFGLHETDLTDMRVQFRPDEVFSACENRPLEIRSVSDLNILSVKGVQVEKVRACTRDVMVQGYLTVETHFVIEAWQAFAEWLSFDVACATDEEVDHFAKVFADMIQPFDLVGKSNKAGAVSDLAVDSDLAIEVATHAGSVMHGIWGMLAACGRAQRHILSKPDETIALFDKRVEKEAQAERIEPGERDPEYFFGKRFFVTESGRLGFGFSNVRPGDHIFVIYGEIYPHVLRRCGEEYHHLGEAFVRDYCDGRIVRDIDAGLREAVWIDMR